MREIYLIRHGQSQGNANKDIYKTIPDYALRLTEKGRSQAINRGINIGKDILYPGESAYFYCSPFYRTRDTLDGVLNGIAKGWTQKFLQSDEEKGPFYSPTTVPKFYEKCIYEDSRLREQEWGQLPGKGFDENAEKERDHFGPYYYRFQGGESCADVEDRISSFLNTLWRDFQKEDFPNKIFIITHGMTMRVFLKRWFHRSVEEFESWANPENCGMVCIKEYKDEKSSRNKFRLEEELKKKDRIVGFPYIPYNELVK